MIAPTEDRGLGCNVSVPVCVVGQLPQPLGSSLEREPCMEVIHAVGKISRPMDFYPIALPRQYAPRLPRGGRVGRVLAPQRLRELPSAAAQRPKSTTAPKKLPPAFPMIQYRANISIYIPFSRLLRLKYIADLCYNLKKQRSSIHHDPRKMDMEIPGF